MPTVWNAKSKDVLILQQETEFRRGCGVDVVALPEWAAVEKNLQQENAAVRLLRPVFPLEIPYRLIPRAEILADDAVVVKFQKSSTPPTTVEKKAA